MGQIETTAFGGDLDAKALLLERADQCERGAVVIIELTRNGSTIDTEPGGSYSLSHTNLYASELYAVARMIEHHADEILFNDE